MIEHVRRRAIISQVFDDVIVATCDEEISNLIKDNKGKVLMTSNKHTNGTTRVAEAILSTDCTHVVLLQGDEPLILPKHLKLFYKKISSNPNVCSWNGTGIIEKKEDLDRHSFVKCIISNNENIVKCFRYFSKLSKSEKKEKNIKKILGIIAYKRDFLINISNKNISINEKNELIEQMRIIDNNFDLKSISIEPTLPSVNEPHEADIVKNYILSNTEQQNLLDKVLNWE